MALYSRISISAYILFFTTQGAFCGCLHSYMYVALPQYSVVEGDCGNNASGHRRPEGPHLAITDLSYHEQFINTPSFRVTIMSDKKAVIIMKSLCIIITLHYFILKTILPMLIDYS